MLLALVFALFSPAAAVCDDAAFHQFDFWRGAWEVRVFGEPGPPVGHNRIDPIAGGCALQEFWTSAQGKTGTSLNLYNPVDQTWRQLWVSDQGYQLDITGGWSDGAMRMDGEIVYYDGRRYPFRGVWTPRDDGSVRQTFHEYREDAWQPWFDGLYTPSKATAVP